MSLFSSAGGTVGGTPAPGAASAPSPTTAAGAGAAFDTAAGSTPTTAPVDGDIRISNNTINSGDPLAGGVFVYSSDAGGFVSSKTGQLASPLQASGLSHVPDGYKLTNSDGSTVIYSQKTGGFTDSSGNPVDATKVNGTVAPYSAPSVNPVDAIYNAVSGTADALGLGSGGAGGKIDTNAITQAANTSSATGANLLNQAANYQGGTAQQLTPAQAQAALAAQGSPVLAGGYSGATLSPAAQAQASLAAQQAPIQAQQLQAAQAAGVNLAPTALADTQTLAPASLATGTQLSPAAQAQAAQLNLANANQTRGQQEGLINSLQGTIAGTNPSVAAILLKQQTEQNIANQWAQAQAASGMNTGLAQREAMINSANANQSAIGQQALLRAQEIASAQGLLGTNLGNISGQDVGVASTQAQLQQQAALANQSATNTASQAQLSADVQTKLANAGFLNTQAMNQAQLNQAIALANAGFKNTASTTQAQLDQATQQLNTQQQNSIAQGNQSASLAANTSSANLANQVALANAASQTATSQSNAAQSNAINEAQGQLTSAAGIANANNLTSANTTTAQLANQVALANANNQTQTSQTNAAQANAVGTANQTADLNQQSINNTAQNNLTTAGVTSQGQAITGTVGAAQAQAQAEAAQAAKLGAAATGAAALLSDRRAKKDIGPAGPEIAQFISDIKANKFTYQDGGAWAASPGTNYGAMAQDLERNPVGKSLVMNTPEGKMIDTRKATMAALAAIAELDKKIDRNKKAA